MSEQTETRIALIGIIIEQSEAMTDSSITERVNSLLHEYSPYVVGRMGLPYKEKGIAIISVVIHAENDVISSLSGKLGQIKGVSAKTLYSKAQ